MNKETVKRYVIVLTNLFGNDSFSFSHGYQIVYAEGVLIENGGKVFFKYKSTWNPFEEVLTPLAYDTLDEVKDALFDLAGMHYDLCNEAARKTVKENYDSKKMRVSRPPGLDVPEDAYEKSGFLSDDIYGRS